MLPTQDLSWVVILSETSREDTAGKVGALLRYNFPMPHLPGDSANWLAGLLLFYWFYRTFLLGYPRFRVDEPLDLDDDDTLRIISSLSNALVCPKNHIEPINDGKNFYPAQLNAIRNARHSVNITSTGMSHIPTSPTPIAAMTADAATCHRRSL